jgi:hypothetical protein
MSLRKVVTALVLCGAALTVGPVAAAQDGAGREDTPTAAEVDGPLPRLGEVGPVTDAPEGLSLSPAIVEVPLQPGRRSEVVHVVANATGSPLMLRLEAIPASVDRDGPQVDGTAGAPDDGSPTRLVLPLDRLALDDGEGAELRSTGEVAPERSLVVALRATPLPSADAEDGAGAVAYVVLIDGDSPSGLQVTAAEVEAADTLAGIALATDRHAVVDVRVRVHSWLGVLHDRTTADLLVGPEEPRVLEVARPAGSPPGRLHLEVVAVDRTGVEARASLTTTAGAAGWLVVLAVVLVLAAAAAVVVVGRRLRSAARRPSSPPTDPPAAEERDP